MYKWFLKNIKSFNWINLILVGLVCQKLLLLLFDGLKNLFLYYPAFLILSLSENSKEPNEWTKKKSYNGIYCLNLVRNFKGWPSPKVICVRIQNIVANLFQCCPKIPSSVRLHTALYTWISKWNFYNFGKRKKKNVDISFKKLYFSYCYIAMKSFQQKKIKLTASFFQLQVK